MTISKDVIPSGARNLLSNQKRTRFLGRRSDAGDGWLRPGPSHPEFFGVCSLQGGHDADLAWTTGRKCAMPGIGTYFLRDEAREPGGAGHRPAAGTRSGAPAVPN